jgi:hypothetical protein
MIQTWITSAEKDNRAKARTYRWKITDIGQRLLACLDVLVQIGARMDWLTRFRAQPSFQSSLLTWCPPDLTDDLKTFGQQSWPQVKQILTAVRQ